VLLCAVVTATAASFIFISQSIRSYFANDDDFNWNYGLALAATGKYREAEEALGAVQNDKYR
jgi:intraflagellar transport protein 56